MITGCWTDENNNYVNSFCGAGGTAGGGDRDVDGDDDDDSNDYSLDDYIAIITCDQALFSFRSVKHSGGKGETKNRA